MIEAESQVDDARNLEIRRMLRDPIFVRSLGRLEIDFRIGLDEKRYVKEDVDAGDEASKGKVLVETVALTIRKGRDVVFKKTYRGHKSRKAEAFSSGAPIRDGYLLKVNSAEVDCVEIAEALLAGLDENDLRVALGSNNKYIRAAATAVSDSWRGGSATIESGNEGAIDDD
jgi:hypothetical protein